MSQESRVIKVQRKAAAGSTAQTKSVERGSVLGKIDTGEEKQTCKPCFAIFEKVLCCTKLGEGTNKNVLLLNFKVKNLFKTQLRGI